MPLDAYYVPFLRKVKQKRRCDEGRCTCCVLEYLRHAYGASKAGVRGGDLRGHAINRRATKSERQV